MKKKFLNPIAAMAVVALTMASCASSNETETTAMDGTTMSETQTMAGSTEEAEVETDMDADGVETEVEVAGTEAEVDADMSVDMTYANMFDDLESTEQYDIMALARSNPNLSTFVSLAEMAGMEAALNNAGTDFTVFIPVNEAFESLPKEEYDRLTDPANKAELIKVLQAHVLPNNVLTSQFQNNQRIETADGKTIDIAVRNAAGGSSMVTIGGANVVKPNVQAANGTVHIIDAIITPTDNATDGME